MVYVKIVLSNVNPMQKCCRCKYKCHNFPDFNTTELEIYYEHLLSLFVRRQVGLTTESAIIVERTSASMMAMFNEQNLILAKCHFPGQSALCLRLSFVNIISKYLMLR